MIPMWRDGKRPATSYSCLLRHLHDATGDSRAGVAARLRSEIVRIRVKNDCAAECGARTAVQSDGAGGKRGADAAIRSGTDVAEVAGVVRGSSRIGVRCAGG